MAFYAGIGGLERDFGRAYSATNKDGSVDIYFGPTAPKGNETNWIQTNKGESFFVYLRLYGPEQAYFDQTFPMNKIKKVQVGNTQ